MAVRCRLCGSTYSWEPEDCPRCLEEIRATYQGLSHDERWSTDLKTGPSRPLPKPWWTYPVGYVLGGILFVIIGIYVLACVAAVWAIFMGR
jgi:hypothetical protein